VVPRAAISPRAACRI